MTQSQQSARVRYQRTDLVVKWLRPLLLREGVICVVRVLTMDQKERDSSEVQLFFNPA